MEGFFKWAQQFFAEVVIEKIWGWVIATAIGAAIVGWWHWLATNQPGFAVVAGLAALCFGIWLIDRVSQARRKKRSSDVDGSGLEFFETKDALIQNRPLIELQLNRAQRVKAAFLFGRKLIVTDDDSLRRITHLLLPDPDAQGLKFYVESIGENYNAVKTLIKTVTQTAQTKYNIQEVRWCPVLVNFSFMLGDPDKLTGWAQAEFALPYSSSNKRPSLTVYRKDFDSYVTEFDRTFDELWKNSVPPRLEEIPAKVVSETFVTLNLENGGLEIISQKNIASITDNGNRDFTVNFLEEMPNSHYFVDMTATKGSIDWTVEDQRQSSCRMTYAVIEPTIVRIIFMV